MRLRIEYFDQNETFAPLLPREGLVESVPECSDSTHKWHLLRLDAPVVYEGTEYSHFLVASRWRGHEIGGDKPPSVFILLVPAGHGVSAGFSHKQYSHVAWGVAHVLRT